MIKVNRQKLYQSHEGPWLLLDLAMLGLLISNLILIIFDSLFALKTLNRLLTEIAPEFVRFYQPIHDDFLFVDLAFVSVFLAEFLLRWGVAIYNKTFLRWYFFPFVHWYDLLGCIPLSGMRLLRFLRIFSILYRLHKYQIIDVRNTAIIRFLSFYYDALVEELTDRILVKALTEAQEEIKAGSPILDELSERVIKSGKPMLSGWAATLLNHTGELLENTQSDNVLRQHIARSVARAVDDNPQVSQLSWLPIVGRGLERRLETAVADIVVNSLVNMLKDITPQQLEQIAAQAKPNISEADEILDREVLRLLREAIEVLKEHIAKQKWKLSLQNAPTGNTQAHQD